MCSSMRTPSPKEILKTQLQISRCSILESGAGCGLGSTWSTTASRIESPEDTGQKVWPSIPKAPVFRNVGTPNHQLPNLRQCQNSASPAPLEAGLVRKVICAKARTEPQQSDTKKNSTLQPSLAPCPQPAEKVNHSQQRAIVEQFPVPRRPAGLQLLTPEPPREPQGITFDKAWPQESATQTALDEAKHDAQLSLPLSHGNPICSKPVGPPPAGNPPLQRRLHSACAPSGEAI